MVDANLKIIGELKLFLELVSADPGIRKLVTECENDFTREKKIAFKTYCRHNYKYAQTQFGN